MRLSQIDIIPTGNDESNEADSFGQASILSDVQLGPSIRFRKRAIHNYVKPLSAILLALMMVVTSFLAVLGATDDTDSKSITMDAPGQESVVTRVYDMFNVPLGGWWSDRYQEQVVRSTFPVAYEWFGTPSGNTFLYSDYRMNVTAKNISKVNTSDNPWYVPTFNPTVRGGNITLDWRANYLTKSEAVADYPSYLSDWYDSWFWRWNGTVTMDQTAAKMVLNMTDLGFSNFATWKADKFPLFKQKFSTWIQEQMNIVWAIKFSYEYEGNTLFESYDIQKVGNTIVFQILDHLSWGAECLLSRWWSHTFMQFEGYPEDVHFTAQMDPASSNFNLDMAVQYSLFAATGTRDDRTCWIFENTHADAVQGSSGTYVSEFNNYYGKKTWSTLIANSAYMKWRDYDYTPWAWNLTSANHKITIEWPDSSAIIGYQYNGTNNHNKTIVGKVTPIWVEPLPGELPSNVQVNSTSRTIEITGPLDTLTWSNTTLGIPELQENWTRVGHLPRGCPYVEFVVNNDVNQSPIAAFDVPAYVATGANATLDASGSWDPDGSIVSYAWDFGDGSPSGTGVVAFHTWAIPNNYTVTLTVTDNSSQSSSLSKVVQVRDNIDPVAVINGTRNGAVGELMQFDGLGSYDPDGSIASYLWEFSDGTTATGPVAYHVSPDYCNYSVDLTVTDDLGATNTASMLVIIGLGGPVAKIAMPEMATVGQNIVLSGAESYSSTGSTLINYSWDFGDGSVGYGNYSIHSWSLTGSYIVTLSVKDDLGAWSRPACAVIEVLLAGATAVSVSLEKHSLLPSEATTLTLSIVDASGNVVTDFTGDVSVACNESTGVTIPITYTFTPGDAGIHEFVDGVSFSLEGSYNVSASVDLNPSIFGYDFTTVCNRTVEIRIYDIFELPLPDYWLRRSLYYLLGDEGFRNTSPVVGIYRTGVDTAGQLWTTYMMNVEARNIPEINMSSPTFAALKNPTTGRGNATVDLDYHMLTQAEIIAIDGVYIGPGQSTNWDGWEYLLTCNVTMDRAAAEQIIGLPLPTTLVTQSDGSTTFYIDTAANLSYWWDVDYCDGSWMPGNFTITDYWDNNYLGGEGGVGVTVGRLDLKSCEDYYNFGQGLWNSSCMRLVYLDADHVSLSYWNVGYGYDNLLSRFLYWGGIGSGANYPNGTPNGIVPFEPWYDNMSLRVDISDDHANVSMYGGVIYGFRAWESDVAPEGTAVWRWENQRLDYLISSFGGLSELDIFRPLRDSSDPRYELRDPGSSLFGMTAQYDYVPAVMTLKPGESLVIEEPRSMAVGYLPQKMIGDIMGVPPYLGGYYDSLRMLERFGNATIHAIGTPAGTAAIDARTGDLKIVGPFYPIVNTIPGYPWLQSEPAPRIELWVGPMEVHAPCAAFTVAPATGDTTTVFNFNASFSCDVEDTPDQLEFRWDWTGDGAWETGWSNNTSATQNFPFAGNYSVWLEVRDSSGLTNITERIVRVSLLPLSSQFAPPHSDYGKDTNGNGLYDYLMVNVSLNIASTGGYWILGLLNDSMGVVESNVTYAYLNAGPHNVEVPFIGSAIFNTGYSGLFTVDLFLFDEATTDLLDTDSYTTGWYNYTQFDIPSQFVPPFSDCGNDTNGNGLYEYLGINCTVNITSDGWYWVSGYLYDSSWSSIDWDYIVVYLTTGLQNLTIWFSGLTIYNYGYSGPIFVDLYLYDNVTLLDTDSYTTNWYDYSQFDSSFQPAYFVPPYSDFGEDLNANGLYDNLVMNVSVNANLAGWYWVSGELFDDGWSYVSWYGDFFYLNMGVQTVQLRFLSGAVFNHGYNGSYFVTIGLYDSSGVIEIDNDTYTTNAYTYDQFEIPSNHFAPPHSDYGEDTNANGLFDYLVLNVSLDVSSAGWYWMEGDLYDSEWNFITWNYVYVSLSAGYQIIEIRFNGTDIGNSSYDGPYYIDLYLYNDSWNLSDYDSYTTNPYACIQFEHAIDVTPPATLLSLSGTLGANGWYVSTVKGTLSATDFESGVNCTYYRIRINGGSWGNWITYAGEFSLTGNGTYDIEYYSTDIAGNSESIQGAVIKIDKVGPTTTSYSYSYDLVLSATDNPGGSGVNSTWYRVWTVGWGAWTKYTGVITLGTTGNLAVQFHSIDNAGNYGTDINISMPIADSTDPVTHATLSGTLGANDWYVSQVNVTLAATDDLSGVGFIHYRADGSDWKTYSSTIRLTVGGVHKIEFYATDNYGNDESIQTVTVRIDTAPPTSVVTVDGLRVKIAGDDGNGSGVDKIYYRIDGGSWSTYSSPINLTAAGNHTVEYYSVDKAGNSEGIHAIVVGSNGQGGGIFGLLPGDLLLIMIPIAIGIVLLVLFVWKKKGNGK
jgi:chitodextrinase